MKKIFIVVILFNLFVSSLFNVGIIESDLISFYEIKKEPFLLKKVVLADNLISKTIYKFSEIVGFNGGYSFFAPNVASSFIIVFNVHSKNHSKMGVFKYNNVEEKNRINLLYDVFMNKLEIMSKNKLNTNDTIANKCIDVIAKNFTLQYLNSNNINNFDSVECNIFISNEKSIKQIKNGEKPDYKKLFFYKYKK